MTDSTEVGEGYSRKLVQSPILQQNEPDSWVKLTEKTTVTLVKRDDKPAPSFISEIQVAGFHFPFATKKRRTTKTRKIRGHFTDG